ncbi:MAG: chemotaxis protein CheW [Cyanobacteria bacterium]|nr:chemotaxis protein CheW [Cyanobacteriota bacterium]
MTLSSSPLLPLVLPGARSPHTGPQPSRPETLRAICFGVEGYRFALPVTAISKVAHCPSLDGTDLGKAGLVHIDSQVIQILDLRTLLHPHAPEPAPAIAPEQFLVVAHCQGRAPVGIPTDAPPDLLEIPRAAVRPLPPHGDRAHLSNLATFVAVLGTDGQETSIFLLDLARTLALP